MSDLEQGAIRNPRLFIAVALLPFAAAAASAQTDPPTPATSGPPHVTWSAAAGYESFWLRDVASTGPPVDASPVSWVGRVPAFSVRHDRARTGRLHRFELAFASAGDFSFETPVSTIPRASGDHVTRLDGRYEYRRYPFRDLLADGLDVGICDPIFGPTTPDSNWNVHDMEHFSFYVRPGSFAEQNVSRLSDVLEDQYTVTVATLGLRYNGRVSAFLYNSAADGDLESDHSGSGYPDTETFRAVCVPPLGGNLFGFCRTKPTTSSWRTRSGARTRTS